MTTRGLYNKACLEWSLKHTDLLLSSDHYLNKYPMGIDHIEQKDDEDREFDLDQGHFYDKELYHWYNILCEEAINQKNRIHQKKGSKLKSLS